jgi:hypothetical protein
MASHKKLQTLRISKLFISFPVIGLNKLKIVERRHSCLSSIKASVPLPLTLCCPSPLPSSQLHPLYAIKALGKIWQRDTVVFVGATKENQDNPHFGKACNRAGI